MAVLVVIYIAKSLTLASILSPVREQMFHPQKSLMHLEHLLDLIGRSVPPGVDFLVETLVDGIIRLEVLRQHESIVMIGSSGAVAGAATGHR